MQSSSHLDWFQATFPVDFSIKGLVPMTGDWASTDRGLHGYTQGFQAECGAWAYTGGNERMGVHLILGGNALEKIRRGVTDRELCQFSDDNRGRASRIDLTVNLINSPLTVKDVADAWRHRELKTSAREGMEDIGVNAPGHTLYIGSPTSDRRARVYDKYAETAVKDPAAFEALKGTIDSWLRFEIQSRNDRARGYQGALVYNPTEEVIKTAMRDFIAWDDQTFNAAMTSADCGLPELPRKPPKFWIWMQKQVIPAAARYQLDNPDEKVGVVLNLMLEDQLKRLTT